MRRISKFIIIFFIITAWIFSGFPPIWQNPSIPPEVQEAKAAPGKRARTVQIWAGQFGGNGVGGQNSNTNLTLDSQSFKLAETGVTIKNAFVVLETQLNGSADRGNTTGHILAFDACASPCTPDPWAGTGRVEQNQGTTVLQYQDNTGSHYVRLLLDVTAESQLAAYTGDGSSINFQVGYRFNNGATAATIDSVKAKLFITYTYDDTSANITNTVIYPLESTVAGDQGTRRASQASGCTRNSNCPTFNYNMDIAEFSERVSQWFEVGGFNDGNSSTDVTRNINIQGTDIDSSTFYLEAAQGGAQGNWSEAWWSGVPGFSENTAQTLEHYFAGGTQYLIGGEVFETYIASSSAATKTKTVSFPIGVITNDITVANTDYTASTTVYFAESGVSIKKAWLRIIETGDDASGAHTFSVKTKVGNNAQSAASTYNQNPGGTIITQLAKIIHVIPSSDYAELASATATSGKDVVVAVQASNTEIDGVSAELMITYTYTGESNGYLTSLALFAGQTATAGNSQSETLTSVVTSVLPETTGAKTIRAAALRASYAASDSDGAMPSNDTSGHDANLSTGTPACTNAYVSGSDSANAYHEYYRLVTSAMNTTDNQSYSACYSNAGYGDASAGAKMNGWLIYTYQLDLPTFNQSAYRLFNNLDSTDVGTPLAAQDTPATLAAAGDAFRLRMLLHIGANQLAINGQSFKLQFAQRGTDNLCDTSFTGETYADVTTATVIAYNDNPTPADGATLTANANDPTHGADTIVNQTYEELNNFTNSVAAIPSGQDGKWDFSLKDNGAPAGTSYCFRVVKSDGTLLNTYTVIPEITTATAVNQPPTVSNVNLNAGQNINLTENTTTLVTATGTVSDANGYQDITSVICRIYRSGVGSSCTLDNNNCYEVTGATSSCAGNDCVATCNFNIYFHAEPTDAGSPWATEIWVAWIKAIDSQNASSSATNTTQAIEMNTLLALEVTPSINYGTMLPGDTTDPLNVLAVATTTGNAAIDANISGTQLCTDYPTCAGNTIATSSQRYATSSVAYASGYTLSATPTLLEFTTGKPTTSPSNQAQSIYWGISIPLGTPMGDYTGENTFTAVAD